MTTTQRISLVDAAKCFDLIEGCTELGDNPVGWQSYLTSGIERLIGTGAGVFAVSRANGTPGRVELLEAQPSAPDETLRSRLSQAARAGADASPEMHTAVLAVGLTADGFIVTLGVQSARGWRRFSQRDYAIVRMLLDLVVPRLGGRLALRSQQGTHPLSPRLRDTLNALLDGANEKEVAFRLGISPATVHEYVGALYRRFGVRSRNQLLSRFVRRRLSTSQSGSPSCSAWHISCTPPLDGEQSRRQ